MNSVKCNERGGVHDTSDGRREGRKEGSRIGDAKRLVSAVQKMMDKYHFSFEDACDGCDATVEEYHKAVELLKKEDIT